VKLTQEPSLVDQPEKWGTDLGKAKRGPYSYNNFFSDLLDGQTFEDWARERKKRGLTTHAFDPMGPGMISEEEPLFDSVTGMRLKKTGGEPRDTDDRQVLSGDLMATATWRRLDASMAQRKIKYFDLIIARPLAGIARYSAYAKKNGTSAKMLALFHENLQKLWNRLNPNEGTVFFEVDQDTLKDPLFQQWIVLMKKNGFDFDYETLKVQYGAFRARLTRHPGSPTALP